MSMTAAMFEVPVVTARTTAKLESLTLIEQSSVMFCPFQE